MPSPRKKAVAAKATRKGYRTCTKCKRNRAERFFKPRGRVCSTCLRKRVSTGTRAQRVEETYGLTLEQYDELLAAQDGKCAICRGTRSYNLDIDHDHALERALIDQGVPKPLATFMSLRGLLCKQCNRRILRSVRDSVEILQSAIEYLLKPPAFAVLKHVHQSSGFDALLGPPLARRAAAPHTEPK